MLAERALLGTVLFAGAFAATVAVTMSAMRPDAPNCSAYNQTDPVVVVQPTPPALETSDECPAHVRAAIRLDNADLYCVRGNFPTPATFVRAYYTTTEDWERLAVIADDGTRVVPMIDQPSLPHRPGGLVADDIDNDGIDEVLVPKGMFTVRGGTIAVQYFPRR